MRKIFQTSGYLVVVALSGFAFAVDGVINFTGRVIDSVCNVTPSLNVDMGDVALDKLSNLGDRVNPKNFELIFTECPNTVKNAQVRFEGTADSTDATVFQLDNLGKTGSASGIGLEIKGPASVIQPGATSEVFSLDTSGADTSMPFTAAYKVTGDKVTAGDANVSVQFSVFYN